MFWICLHCLSFLHCLHVLNFHTCPTILHFLDCPYVHDFLGFVRFSCVFDFVSIFGNLSGLGRTFFGRLVFVDASALVSLVFLRRRRRPGRRRRRQPMLVPRTVPVAPLPLLLLPLVPVRIRRLPVFVFPLARVLGPLLAAFSAVLSPNVGFEQAAEKNAADKISENSQSQEQINSSQDRLKVE